MIVARPLRGIDWRFFSASLARRGIQCHAVGLTAEAPAIARRARKLDDEELHRSAEMAREGYGRRPFSTVIFATDAAPFRETALALADRLRRLLPRG